MPGRDGPRSASRSFVNVRPKYLDNPPPSLQYALRDVRLFNRFAELAHQHDEKLHKLLLPSGDSVLTSCSSSDEFLGTFNHSSAHKDKVVINSTDHQINYAKIELNSTSTPTPTDSWKINYGNKR